MEARQALRPLAQQGAQVPEAQAMQVWFGLAGHDTLYTVNRTYPGI